LYQNPSDKPEVTAMEATETRLPNEKNSQLEKQLRCPLCAGIMLVLRDERRCCQCYFRICESCEGDREPDG
jgi:hypothetical protein